MSDAIKTKKAVTIKKIKEKIDTAKVWILTDYRGMTVKEISELRKKLRGCDAEYKVVKNTFTVRALPEAQASLKSILQGPMAVVFGYNDVVEPTKILAAFIKEAEKPKILGGVVEGQFFEEKGISALAKLKSKEALRAELVWKLKSPLSGLVNVLQGNIRKLVYALDAVKNKKSQGGE
ncbi:MAG: 50S ribosomal protein L10 [Candidatus Margulisiibacteriota bacterium]